MEATLTQPRTYLEIQLNTREITPSKQLNKSKRESSKPGTHIRTSFNTTCPHLHNRMQEVVDRITCSSVNQLEGRTHQRKRQQQSKLKDIHRDNIKDSPKRVSSADQGDCTIETHRYSIVEAYTIDPEGHNRSI